MPIDQQILQRLQANDRTLTELDLNNSKLTASDMQELVKALQGNTTLESLNVSYNQIGDEEAKALAKNQVLIELDIGDNPIANEALAQIKQMLVANKQRRRNQFILTLGKVFSRASALASMKFALPVELIVHIGSYLAGSFYLQFANIKHPNHLGKTEQQVYQAMLFLLYQFTEGGWVEASIREHQPPVNQALDHRRHFTLFNPAHSPKANAEELNTPIACALQ